MLTLALGRGVLQGFLRSGHPLWVNPLYQPLNGDGGGYYFISQPLNGDGGVACCCIVVLRPR